MSMYEYVCILYVYCMYIVCILYDFCTYGYLGTYGMYIYI
jgi:hypothetical protein